MIFILKKQETIKSKATENLQVAGQLFIFCKLMDNWYEK